MQIARFNRGRLQKLETRISLVEKDVATIGETLKVLTSTIKENANKMEAGFEKIDAKIDSKLAEQARQFDGKLAAFHQEFTRFGNLVIGLLVATLVAVTAIPAMAAALPKELK